MKKTKIYSSYKKKMKIKKMFFPISKISCIFSSNIDQNILLESEWMLSKTIGNIRTWEKEFLKCVVFFDSPFNLLDWASFARFFYYVWEQKKFLHKGYQKDSIYNMENFNEINSLKTKEYNQWLKSLMKTNKIDFNIYLRRVLKIL